MGETYEDFDFDAAKNRADVPAESPLTALETLVVRSGKAERGPGLAQWFAVYLFRGGWGFATATGSSPEEAEKHADEILRAVNRDAAFEALVEALNDARKAIRSVRKEHFGRDPENGYFYADELNTKIDAALALAQPDTAERVLKG